MARLESDAFLLDLIYRSVTDSDALTQSLDGLASRYRCQGAALLHLDSHAPAANVILGSAAWDENVIKSYLDYAALDPAPRAFVRVSRGTASTTDRMFATESRKHSAFAQEFYYPRGFHETLGACLIVDKARFGLLGLHRGDDRPAFDDDEIADLERILPHLVRAFQLRRVFAGLEVKARGLEDVVERIQAGAVLLDGKGAALFANRTARKIFGRDDGMALDRNGRLLIAHPDARRRLDALLANIGRGGSGGAMAVPRSAARQPYPVLVAPAPTPLAIGILSSQKGGGAILLVHDPAGRTHDPAALLQATLGLTSGAAKIAAALAEGDDLKSFAERQGVTIHTARFHLHVALTRTETKTQAELVGLVVRLLRDLALRRDD